MKWVERCTLCDNADLTLLWDLPQLPLSETYGKYDPTFRHFDQQLVMCPHCEHVQLKCQLDPAVLYNQDDYHYKTANSGATPKRFACFHDFVCEFLPALPDVVIDIGGNDESLVSTFDCSKRYVVDPSIQKSEVKNDVTFVKAFAEHINLAELNADLVVFSHVLEHMVDPKGFISQLFESCTETTYFALEVPCFDRQIGALRFDAFFHQHLHYFHADSLQHLIHQCGGEIVAMQPSSVPTCGGALMVVFKQSNSHTQSNPAPTPQQTDRVQRFEETKRAFLQRNHAIANWITEQDIVFGYGASLLLPVIFYHIGDASKEIHVILDDDAEKAGLTYKNIPNVQVSLPADQTIPETAAMLVTSYENIPLLQSVIQRRFQTNVFEGFSL